MQVTRDFSHYVRAAGEGLQHIDLAVEGVHCAGCMAKIERGLSAIPDVTLARVNLTDRRVALEWKAGHARSCQLHRSPRTARLQGLSLRDRERGGDRGRGIALPAALPRRRRVCDHERDDAVDPGVVRQRLGHAARAARLLPLAVGADRAAGGSLCRPAVLPLGLARAVEKDHEHGRSDLDRGVPCARHVRGRDHQPRRARLFRRGDHAAHLPAGRPRPRPEHAAADPRGRRQSRRAEGRDGGQIHRRRRDLAGAGRRDSRRRHRSAASRRALRGRRDRDRGTLRDRPEPDHRRDPLCHGRTGHRGLCRLDEYLRHAAGASLGGLRGDAAGRDHAAAGQRAAGPLALHAAGRPRLAALRAGGACDRAAHHPRLGHRRRELA